jgi:aminoglycoside phosphotransferase (APT) family kinase protein
LGATDGLNQRLLDYLRGDLGEPSLKYAEPPTAISGGFDTQVFRFQVQSTHDEWSRPLVLRLLGSQHDPRRALREGIIQNTVATLGYPAPRVLVASADTVALGAAFLVMERLVGRPMLAARWLGVASALAETQARLHLLDPRPLLLAMESSRAHETLGFQSLLAQLHHRIERHALDGLRPSMHWLLVHQPSPPARPVICHGDFHPQNVLMASGTVTGVLDWPNALVADAAYDVASTRVILGLVPIELSGIPPALRPLVRAGRRLMLGRYLAAYRRCRPLDLRALAYYEAASSMRQLVRVAEARVSGRLTPLDRSVFGERVAARFHALTGVAPEIPASPTSGELRTAG